MTQQTTRACGASEDPRAADQARLHARMRRIGRKILVLSGKGGVGKSTVAANLAASLAAAGKTVGLLDVDLHGPSIPGLLGLTGRRIGASSDGGIAPIRLSANLSVVSVALLLDSAGDAVIWRGPMKYNVIRQFLTDVDWGRLDFLVIDSPPGTGDEPLAVAQLVGEGAWAVVVTTPQQLAVADVRRSVSFCKTLDLHVAGIVENMSGLVCPHCGERIEPFAGSGGQRLAEEMDVPLLGRIPMDPGVAVSGDRGTPFVASAPDSPAAAAFAAVVRPILNPPDMTEAHDSDTPSEETPRMKIAIPLADGKLCLHFGHCRQFAIVETDEAGSIAATTLHTPPPHEPGALPRWLAGQGVNVVIAGGMGGRAQGLLADNGIDVVVGARPAPPEEVASAYLAGTLETGGNVCDH